MFNLLIFIFLLHLFECKQILFLFNHFLHGARSPWIGLNYETKTDIFNEKWENEGELTSIGMRQIYLLGNSIKNKYYDFIKKYFNSNNIFVYSSDLNRTIQSGYSFISGIYYENELNSLKNKKFDNKNFPFNLFDKKYYSKINEKLNEFEKNNSNIKNFNLIPVKIFNKYKREFNLYENEICPFFEKAENFTFYENFNDFKLLIKEFLKNYGKIFKIYLNITNDDYFYERFNTYTICDSFIVDYLDQRNFSDFKKIIKKNNLNFDFEEFYNFSLEFCFKFYYYFEYKDKNYELATIGSSNILRNYLYYIKQYKSNKNVEEIPKILVYSGHDSTLAFVSLLFNKIFNIKIQKGIFASNQIFEFYKNESGYFIDFIEDGNLSLTIEYDNFIDKINSNIFEQDKITKWCFKENEDKLKNDNYKIYNILLNYYQIIVIILHFITGFLIYQEFRKYFYKNSA